MFVGYACSQKGYKCWDPIGKRLFVSMDVTFHEWEPYYKTQDDLAQFLEEFSPAPEGACREGKNEKVIVGTIPCPMEWVDKDNGEGKMDEDNGEKEIVEQEQEGQEHMNE